jgi:hypothetical protein
VHSPHPVVGAAPHVRTDDTRLDGATVAAKTTQPCLPEATLHSHATAAVERVRLAVAVALEWLREAVERLLRNVHRPEDDDDST